MSSLSRAWVGEASYCRWLAASMSKVYSAATSTATATSPPALLSCIMNNHNFHVVYSKVVLWKKSSNNNLYYSSKINEHTVFPLDVSKGLVAQGHGNTSWATPVGCRGCARWGESGAGCKLASCCGAAGGGEGGRGVGSSGWGGGGGGGGGHFLLQQFAIWLWPWRRHAIADLGIKVHF